MPLLTPPAAVRPAIAPETRILRVGQQRGYPRIYAKGRYLDARGWHAHQAIAITPDGEGLVITRSTAATGKTLHPRGADPVLDLNEELLATLFGDVTHVAVSIDTERIVIRPHARAALDATRPATGTVGTLFTGGAFLDSAAQQAGYTIAWGVELNEDAAHVAALAHPSSVMHTMDVLDALYLPLSRVDTLIAGIPCPAFSALRRTAGVDATTGKNRKRERDATAADHTSADLSFVAYAIIAKLVPRTILIENVPGYATSEIGLALVRGLERLGYAVTMRKVSPVAYGYATDRQRTVIVAQTPDADGCIADAFLTPAVPATPAPIAALLDADVPETAWQTPETTNAFARSEANAASGKGWQLTMHTPASVRVGTFDANYGEAKVRLGSPVLAHPTRPACVRRFSVAEVARLHAVPSSHAATLAQVSTTTAYRLLGNGVHVETFAHILRAVRGPRTITTAAAQETGPVGASEPVQLGLALAVG